MNQWIFLFDGYGIDYNGSNPFPERNETGTSQTRDAAGWDELEGWPDAAGVFQPYMVKFMCNKSAFETPTDDEMMDAVHAYVDYSGW